MKKAVSTYYELLKLVNGKSIILEEYARKLIVEEETHIGEVEKMLRKPIYLLLFLSNFRDNLSSK